MALSIKEDEVLCALKAGPLTMNELTEIVHGGKVVVAAALKALTDKGLAKATYSKEMMIDRGHRGKTIYSAV